MALPSSGAISFGAINVELGSPSNAMRLLGAPTTRTLYGVPSGAIRLAADGYGKSNIPALASQQAYTTPGTYSWVAPALVRSVSVVCVGGGGGPAASASGGAGGGGGGLGWKNNITVVPGTSYTVLVGAGGTRVTTGTAPAGGTSYFINTSTVAGNGGSGGLAGGAGNPAGGTFVGDGGGNGGAGGARTSTANCGGGGGAGGYAGNGGAGGNGTATNGTAGQGGGAGGGGGGGSVDTAGSGGGVGILGQGTSGLAGANGVNDGKGGFGGSGGANASNASTVVQDASTYSATVRSIPGDYGGGGSGSDNPTIVEQGPGAGGAVRIIWAGQNFPTRAFPSTNTGNV